MLIPPSVDAARAEEIVVGLSGARVARLFDSRDLPVAVVKSVDEGRADLASELRGQEARLRWFGARGLPVPRVLGSGRRQGELWLAMSHLPGRPAHEPWPSEDRSGVVRLLARAARALHTAPDRDCPFDATPPTRLEEARERVLSGAVDRSWAAAGREGPPAAAVLPEVVERARALGPGPVSLTHGDYCLPNVLVHGTGVRGGPVEDGGRSGRALRDARVRDCGPDGPWGWGFVDLGRAGLGDPHADLADMVASLLSPMNPQFGPEDAELLLDSYGREDVDTARLRLCADVAAFFWPE